MSGRFTAYFSDPEREMLREYAREHAMSENYVVRSIVRKFLLSEQQRLLRVTSDTPAYGSNKNVTYRV